MQNKKNAFMRAFSAGLLALCAVPGPVHLESICTGAAVFVGLWAIIEAMPDNKN